MLRIFIINLFILCSLSSYADEVKEVLPLKVELKNSLDHLFSHQTHQKVLENMQIRCVDCHRFSIKSEGRGPLGPHVDKKYLKPQSAVCHKCHMSKIAMPVPNQCQLCHSQLKLLSPEDHHNNWIKTHGMEASHSSDSCLRCHTKDGCLDCHLKRDNMNTRVHRGNFRFTHSIEARSNPAACVQCHQSTNFCIDCHKGVRK